MPFKNQTAFLDHCRTRGSNVTVALSNGVPVLGKITAHDQFTLILNGDVPGQQQVDFLNDLKANKTVVSVNVAGEFIEGVVTGADMYNIILNDSIMLFKNSIFYMNPVETETYLVFKNNIAAITL